MLVSNPTPISRQHGVVLIEALVAILIFSLGILGLVALGGQAVGAQSDAQYRTEASGLADAIAGEIAVNVDRRGINENSGALIANSLVPFRHQDAGANCVFNGVTTGNAPVAALLGRAAALPGATAFQQQITVQNGAGSFNRIEITLCWSAANDNGAWRRHTYITYVNGGAV